MSALKNGALLKAFAGKPADGEKVPLPYDDRVVLNNAGREVKTISNKEFFPVSSTSLGRHAISRNTSQVARDAA